MPTTKNKRPAPEIRLDAYQAKLRALKERSALREVMERELLLEFISVNHNSINEYPLLETQQKSVIEILCGRVGHPGYEYIHEHISDFIVQLAHYGKAIKTEQLERAAEIKINLVNTESILLKCVQGIVYSMALITDNSEEIVLRYFGKEALNEYSSLIQEHSLNEHFWKAFVEQFVASKVEEAHKDILEREKYDISKEKNFLVIRFLFDDILAKLKPTDLEIEKTRIQTSYVKSRTEEEAIQQTKFIQSIMVKGLANLPNVEKISLNEYIQGARITCIDTIAADFEKQYIARIEETKARKADPARKDERSQQEIKREQAEFKFLMDQVVAVGIGAAIAIGRTSDHFYKAMAEFVPDQIAAIRPLARDFSIPTLERILYFLLENNTIHILQETGRSEGGKIMVRSARARRVPTATVEALPGMSKIRKKQLFGNDTTRENTLLFKPKTAQQMAETMTKLSLEKSLQGALVKLWKEAVFRVDIMVLINLAQVAKTTTNLKTKLGEILEMYGVSA